MLVSEAHYPDMPSAPLAISSQSKNKQRASEFSGNRADQEADKENVGSNCSLSRDFAGEHEVTLHSSQHRHSQKKECPQTPANKISLADLVGNTEDAFNCAPADITPEDQVFWQHGPRSSDPTSSLHSMPRGKKRARSSSPATSSQPEKSNHFPAQKEPLDLQKLQYSLKTPQNDPATDLWTRYATASFARSNGDGASLAPVPAFAHLITSSPQTPSTTNSKDGGLRRSISCGIEWPASKTKRRKLDPGQPYGRMGDIFASSKKEILALENPTVSRVSLLVEKIQESLSRKQATEMAGPSSSSPLPERTEFIEGLQVSPLPKRIQVQGLENYDFQENENYRTNQTAEATKQEQITPAGEGESSEFGDEELDLNFLETVELAGAHRMEQDTLFSRRSDPEITGDTTADNSLMYAPIQTSPHMKIANASQALPNNSCHQQSPLEDRYICSANQHAPVANCITVEGELDDEFGNGDDDAFATEMQDLMAKYDTQGSASVVGRDQAQPQMQLQPLHHLDSGLDIYMQQEQIDNDVGGTFDDDDNDDDDLWNEIGDETLLNRGAAGVGSTSQVRAFR